MQSNSQFFDFNQVQFTFLVFDKLAVDDFFRSFEPLDFNNENIKSAIAKKLLVQNFDFDQMRRYEKDTEEYEKNTEGLDAITCNLAKNVIKSTLEKGGEEYFLGSLRYLFFYECLPTKFRYKWVQSTLGHFEFNATFFALLWEKSKELDDLIHRNIGTWQKGIRSIFSEYTFNEINLEIATKIRSTILNDNALNDIRFSKDRAIILEFLEKTINKDWRLVLIDWN